MKSMSSNNRQSGAVSIFIVIFTALLITVVTVSFVRIMLRDQQQATMTDLSQSAYDSALAGVEDAKRALSTFYASSGAQAAQYEGVLQSGECSSVSQILYDTGDVAETLVQSTQGQDESLDQAYTCVIVSLQTDDYLGELGVDETSVVPLNAANDFDRVRVEWFSNDDVSDDVTEFTVPTLSESSSMQLPEQATWNVTRPPLLEVQLIQTGSSFTLDQFDAMASGQSNTNTLSLYPQALSTSPAHRFVDNVRRSSVATGLEGVRCLENVNSAAAEADNWGRYSCRATITVPDAAGGGRGAAYLRLTPRYNAAHYKVSLYNGNELVQFDGAQPEVDSTGRANNLFRRVTARIEPGGTVIYPSGAVDIQGNFCKTFRVSDDTADYQAGSCTP